MIGLFFGDGDFPKKIFKKIKQKSLKYLIIDLTKKKKFKRKKKAYVVSIGQFGKIINILKKNRCKKVIFAGKVEKPNFSKLKLDFKGIYYMPRIKFSVVITCNKFVYIIFLFFFIYFKYFFKIITFI